MPQNVIVSRKFHAVSFDMFAALPDDAQVSAHDAHTTTKYMRISAQRQLRNVLLQHPSLMPTGSFPPPPRTVVLGQVSLRTKAGDPAQS